MRQIRVEILTVNDLQILGNITINFPSDNYQSKISDLLNNSRNFIELTDVEIRGSNHKLLVNMPFLCVNKPVIAFLSEAKSNQTQLGSSENAIDSNQSVKTTTGSREQGVGSREEEKILFLPFNWGCEALLGSS